MQDASGELEEGLEAERVGPFPECPPVLMQLEARVVALHPYIHLLI